MSRGELRDDEPWTDERLTGSHRYQAQLYLANSLKIWTLKWKFRSHTTSGSVCQFQPVSKQSQLRVGEDTVVDR